MDAHAGHREPRAIWGLQEEKYKIAHLVSQQPGRNSWMWCGTGVEPLINETQCIRVCKYVALLAGIYYLPDLPGLINIDRGL